MLADAAAVTGRNMEELAFWVGRSYSQIASGAPFGEAAMRLQEMAVLSAAGRIEIDKLGKSPMLRKKNAAAIMAVLNRELAKFAGASEKLALTLPGALSMVKDAWNMFNNELAKGFAPEVTKDLKWFQAFLQSLADFERPDKAERWGAAINKIYIAAKKLIAQTARRMFPNAERDVQAILKLIESDDMEGAIKAGAKMVGNAFTTTLGLIAPAIQKLGALIGKGFVDGFWDGVKAGFTNEGNWVRKMFPGDAAWADRIAAQVYGDEGMKKDANNRILDGLGIDADKRKSLSSFFNYGLDDLFRKPAASAPTPVFIADASPAAAAKLTSPTQGTGGL